MRTLRIFLIGLMVAALAACDRNPEYGESKSTTGTDASAPAAEPMALEAQSEGEALSRASANYAKADAAADEESVGGERPSLGAAADTVSRQMLDRDAYLDIQVRNYEHALDSVRMLVKQWGGYVESFAESNSDSGRVRRAELSVRVPGTRFDGALRGLAGLGSYVNSRNENVTDVTREYHDNLARLKTRKALEQRYQQLLKQARNIKEIMQIERELNNIRYEIESAEAQKRATEFEVRMSQIRVVLNYQKQPSEVVQRPESGFGARLAYAFGQAFAHVGAIFLWLVEVLPSLLILLAVVLVPVWWLRRRRSAKS